MSSAWLIPVFIRDVCHRVELTVGCVILIRAFLDKDFVLSARILEVAFLFGLGSVRVLKGVRISVVSVLVIFVAALQDRDLVIAGFCVILVAVAAGLHVVVLDWSRSRSVIAAGRRWRSVAAHTVRALVPVTTSEAGGAR